MGALGTIKDEDSNADSDFSGDEGNNIKEIEKELLAVHRNTNNINP